ncbi:MAG: laccase domain-containing protein [Burkholderiaceae bacterium]|nr:laccase domain-containing protein [Burkholderiaceae bacterium]
MYLPSCPAAVPHPDWLRPDWPAPAHIHALCTSRAGGVSAAPFDSLNLGDHVGDAPAAVTANRQILQAALQRITPGTQPVFLQQVHGTQVLELQEGQEGHGALSSNFSANFCFDACATSAARTACTIMVADCLPVLLTNRQGSVVAAAHAGWRGLAGKDGKGVLEAVFKHFEALAQAQQALAAIKKEAFIDGAAPSAAADTLVWLGPCIGPQAFEVGAEVRAAFCAHDSAAAVHFVPHGAGKYLADLAGLARQRLHALGITHIYGNDSSAGWCTASNPSRFFSHRRDSAALDGSGRFAVCIWRSG